MIPLKERGANLALDFLVFTEIVLYWPFALLVMKPAQWFDRRFGTKVFPALDRVMRSIADW
jgi:small neutral amino acid transporter SnatA (MarC family)